MRPGPPPRRRARRARSLPQSIAMLLPGAASAHPLGNFTVNHLSQVRISQGSVEVHYILDQAEIPTFQEIQRFDRNGDGAISGAERGPLLAAEARARSRPDLRADRRRTRRPPRLSACRRPSASRRARAVSR